MPDVNGISLFTPTGVFGKDTWLDGAWRQVEDTPGLFFNMVDQTEPERAEGRNTFFKLDIGEVFDMAFTLVGHADLVAVERYVITQRTAMLSQQPATMYVTGAIMMAAHRGNVPLQLETVSDSKASFPDEVLHQLDVWDSNEHVRDAVRCALLGARRSGESIYVGV